MIRYIYFIVWQKVRFPLEKFPTFPNCLFFTLDGTSNGFGSSLQPVESNASIETPNGERYIMMVSHLTLKTAQPFM